MSLQRVDSKLRLKMTEEYISRPFRCSEIFYSLQGEGMRIGHPSVFVRMFGCNLKCRGFGMPLGELSEEYLSIDTSINDIKRLPLVNTGCDSYASWHPKFKHLAKSYTVEELVEAIRIKFRSYRATPDIVFTGGEPLLKYQLHYPELLEKLFSLGVPAVTFETNGTQELSKKLVNYIKSTSSEKKFIFSISPKLLSSGEPHAIRENVLSSIVKLRKWRTRTGNISVYFKFVVSDRFDLAQIEGIAAIIKKMTFVDTPVYLMPEGGTSEGYSKNAGAVAEFALQYGYLYSPRLQVDLYGNAWGT